MNCQATGSTSAGAMQMSPYLSDIWNGKLDAFANRKGGTSSTASGVAGDTASFFLEVLSYDLGLALYGAEAGIRAGAAVLESSAKVISNSPEIAGAVVEGTGEVAGAVFETISEIIGGIFSGL